jgi:predicted TIM-barrel fold metal-dependent hydrolase
LRYLPTSIVDAHHHLWRLDLGHYPWLQEAYEPATFILGEYAPLCRDFTPEDYRAACGAAPVVATVHVEAERDRGEALAESRWLEAQNAEAGVPSVIVAWADFADSGIDAQLSAQASCPLLRGIRCKPRTAPRPELSVRGEPGSMQDPRWLAGLAALEDYGLSWDLRVPFWHLEEAAVVASMFPGIPIVVEHAGLPWDRSEAGLARWRRGMEALARSPQVHVKLSEFGLRDAPWRGADNTRIVRDCVAIFGWQRAMFGSNFPVASLRIGYESLVATVADALADLEDWQQQAIWHDNAARFYRIPSVAGPPA